MVENLSSSEAFQRLRERAKRLLEEKGVKSPDIEQDELLRLAHELEVYQVELEVQNEELQRAKAEAESAREKFFDLYDSVPVAYVKLNGRGDIESANQAAHRLLDANKHVLLGSSLVSFIHGRDIIKYQSFLKQLVSDRRAGPLELRLRGQGGPIHVQLEGTAEFDGKQRIGQYRLAFVDITERKRAEEALRISEERLRIAVNGARLGTWDRDLITGSIVSNRVLYCLLDRDPENSEITVETFFEHIHPEDRERVRRRLYETLATGTDFSDEFRVVQEDRAIRWLAAAGRVYRNRQGQPVRMAGVNYDITDRKRLEEELSRHREELELRVRERTAELQRQYNHRKFLARSLVDLVERDRSDIAMALHDHVGQLLTALRMDLEGIKTEIPGGHLREQVESSVKKLVELLQFVRNISRDLRPSSLDTVGLIPSMRSLLDAIKLNSGINTTFFTKGIPERLHPDKELALYRILQESMNNIVKHADADKVFVNFTLGDETIHLSVEDNGAGFDYQETARAIGSQKGPLGLNIMKERAAQVGGDLWVETEKGKGTVVVAQIPLRHEPIVMDQEP